MNDWDDNPTSAERTWPDLLALQPLDPDDPLLPLVPDIARDQDDYLRPGHLVG
jgi:hypothetical protein